MRKNLGEFSWRGFIITVVCCVALGSIIYRQFSFSQAPKPQDAQDAQISDLEKKVDALQSKVVLLEQEIKTAEAKTAVPKPIEARHGRNQ
jgi:hypothetical protein